MHIGTLQKELIMEKKKQPTTKTSKSKSADWTTLKGKTGSRRQLAGGCFWF
jgi:hypothetical protein